MAVAAWKTSIWQFALSVEALSFSSESSMRLPLHDCSTASIASKTVSHVSWKTLQKSVDCPYSTHVHFFDWSSNQKSIQAVCRPVVESLRDILEIPWVKNANADHIMCPVTWAQTFLLPQQVAGIAGAWSDLVVYKHPSMSLTKLFRTC